MDELRAWTARRNFGKFRILGIEMSLRNIRNEQICTPFEDMTIKEIVSQLVILKNIWKGNYELAKQTHCPKKENPNG